MSDTTYAMEGNKSYLQLQLIPSSILQGFQITIAITNLFVFVFSIGWMVKIVVDSVKLKQLLESSAGLQTPEQIEIQKNCQIVQRRNLILIAVLSVEALHLISKGVGFAMFFYFSIDNGENFRYIIACNRLNEYNIVKGFKYFPITLARIGVSNGLILFLVILLSIVMVYLSNVYNEQNDLKFLRSYLIFGIVPFFIVWITVSVLWTGFEGAIIFSIFIIINCVILFKARNKLSNALFKWQRNSEIYEELSIDTLRRREKLLTRSNRLTTAFVLSIIIYLISIILGNIGNWILMLLPNPCLVKTIFGVTIPEPSNITLEVALNFASILFIATYLGALQFDLFLIVSTIAYILVRNCYITTAYQDRIIRGNVRNMIEEQHSTINRLAHN